MNNELDIAIVGMSGRFPGARNPDEFWRNIAGGVESIARLSDREMLDAGVPPSYLSNPSYVKAAPVLEDPGRFDAAFFGYSPMEARTMDPQHRLLLELAYEALENAGYVPDHCEGRIGVFAGTALNTYYTDTGLNGRLAEDYIPTLIGNDKDFLSSRICYKLNLKGPGITVQTACSTSMIAIHLARQSLLSGETDMALAGASSVRVPHRAGYFCDGGGLLSRDGHVRAFDANADGTVFGSGGGILLLKRLADALAHGDTIRAVIKGSAANNDGSEKAGYTAPSVNGQADAVVEALANAWVEPDTISFIEAHGSGTSVGDPIEIRALTKAFRTATRRSGYCAIGSVKTNVGHLDAAAAIAGIIKTVLALEHRKLPPSLHFTEANPEIDFPSTPFYVNTQLRDWTSDGPRRAGVMSTGMGGTNAHLIIEEAPGQSPLRRSSPPHLFVVSAKTETALGQCAQRLQTFLARHDSVDLGDVAYTLQVGRQAFPHRRCLVCADRADAVSALGQEEAKHAASSRADDARRPIVYLFPGIGDHYVGMGHGLYEEQTVFKEAVDQCSAILEPRIGLDIRQVLYPSSQCWQNGNRAKGIDLKRMLGHSGELAESPEAAMLNQTRFAQPALFTIEYAMARLWQSIGIAPDAMVGHSMGEYVAACLAGVFSLEDALRLIATRAMLVGKLRQGSMLAVNLREHELRPLLPRTISISLVNGPDLCVVAGPVAEVAEFEKTLNEKGLICRPVRNGHAFHSRMLDPIVPDFEAELRNVQLNEPGIPFTSNLTGTWIAKAEATRPAYWAKHASQTARFSDALHEVWQFKNPILIEVGPGRTLGALAMQHPDRQADGKSDTVSSIRPVYENRPDAGFFAHAVARLWLCGTEIRWSRFHDGEPRRRVPLPTYPFEKQRHWLEPLRAPSCVPAAPVSVQKNPNRSEWLYVPAWKRHLPRAVGLDAASLRMKESGMWLVFADESDFAAGLIARLKAAGHHVVAVRAGNAFHQVDPCSFSIDPSNSQHCDRLIQALKDRKCLPDRVIHTWSVSDLDSNETKKDRFDSAQHLGFYSLLSLGRAFAKHDAGRELRFFVISNHVLDVFGSETLCPEKSTLLGPCLVLRQEYPNIQVKCIDIDLPETLSRRLPAEDLVLGEMLAPDPSPIVAYRNGQRWVQSYEPVDCRESELRPAPFRKGGVYLVTGGLGGVGAAISQYLAETLNAKLVLVGRSSLPKKRSWNLWLGSHAEDDPISAKIRAIQRIESAGAKVFYCDSDAGDLEAMRRVIRQARQRFGALHGIIHGAGIVGERGYCEIKDLDRDHAAQHFQAKAHGLEVLEELLEGQSLDFCLLLSSLSSVLGGIGQAAYASANIFMDTFARRHNRNSPVPWLSVNWDVWRHEQPSGDSRGRDAGLGTTLKELGMTSGEAVRMLEVVLALRSAGQLVVSTGNLTARIHQWIKLESVHSKGSAPVPAPARSSSRLAPSAKRHDGPGDDAERQIFRIWQDALGTDDFGIHDSFADLGGHSLMAIRIVAALREAFQIDLPVRALFEAPTIAELSTYIQEQLAAEIDALSDEEAGQLVGNSSINS